MYTHFASVYDRLMGDIPYDRFATLFNEAVNQTSREPIHVIDLGCGTGAMFEAILRRARTLTGIDPSSEMLALAAERAVGYGRRIELLQGSAADFRVSRQADWCLAVCDVMNYTQHADELTRSFSNVKRALCAGGYFLFDLHTPHKIVEAIGDNVYFDAADDAVALMQTKVDPAALAVTYDLLLFVEKADGLYARAQEIHHQRAYPLQVVLECLARAGFSRAHVGADFTVDWLHPESIIPLGNGLTMKVGSALSAQALDEAERWFFLAT